MDFKQMFQSVVEACQKLPVLIGLVALAFGITVFVVVDAHRNKKKRSRHRWK